MVSHYIIGGIVQDFIDAILNGLKAVFFWFVDLIVSIFAGLLTPLLDAFPAIPSGIDVLTDYAGYVNYWIPLTELIVIFVAWSAFISVQIILKLAIKLFVPTVG